MALELVGGAVLGAIVSELLKAVLDAKNKIIYFKPSLERLEMTLNNIAPRLDAITSLKKNHNFDFKENELEELVALVEEGTKLVRECSNISRIHAFKILEHSNQLLVFDYRLNLYFTKILPLDQYKYVLEMMILLKELHEKLILGNDHNINRGSSPQSESESAADKPKEKEEGAVKEEAEKSYPGNSGKMYERMAGKKLFLLTDCPYDFDVEHLENPDHHKVLSEGAYGKSYKCDIIKKKRSYKCDTKDGTVVIKMLNLEAKVGEREFEERMEEIGKIGSHPNIMLPFGYYYSEVNKFLLYEYVPAGSFNVLLEESKSFKGFRSYWSPRLKIAIGIARGISHIHTGGGVIHGNIKTSSVLLTKDLDGCISDFGFAPMMNFPTTTSKKRLFFNLVYNDPPELNETMVATQQSDVFYFGVLLFDIVPQLDFKLLWNPDLRLEVIKVMQIVGDCVHKDPNRRPKMDEVVRILQSNGSCLKSKRTVRHA